MHCKQKYIFSIKDSNYTDYTSVIVQFYCTKRLLYRHYSRIIWMAVIKIIIYFHSPLWEGQGIKNQFLEPTGLIYKYKLYYMFS